MSTPTNKAFPDGHKPMWPGQVALIEFNLAQVRAIASSSRSMVFWTYNSRTPLAVADVAKIVGKSAQSVRYHTNELLKVGLLIVAETRRRHARTEEAYVRAGVKLVTVDPPVTQEYDMERRRGFQSMWRSFDRDRAAAFVLDNVEGGPKLPHHFWVETARLTAEDMKRFRKESTELIEKFAALDREDGIRSSLVALSAPVFIESAQAYLKTTGKKLKLTKVKPEDDDEED